MGHLLMCSVGRGAEARSGLACCHIPSIWLIYIGLILNLVKFGGCAVITENEVQGTYMDNQVVLQDAPLDVAQHHLSTKNLNEEFKGNGMDKGWAANTEDGDDDDGFDEAYDDDGDTLETDKEIKMTSSRHVPVLLLPEYLKHDNNFSNQNQSKGKDEGKAADVIQVTMEYEPGVVLRCAAKGYPRPNTTWEYEGGNLPHYVKMTAITHSQKTEVEIQNDHSIEEGDAYEKRREESWTDLKLPKLNNAFYGRLRCRAENVNGNVTWELELIHNANSSVFMKLVRGTLAGVFFIIGILMIKSVIWVERRRQEKLYEKLPAQDLEIINKFKKGLSPPPPSPSSSIMPPVGAMALESVPVPSCVAVEITVTDNDGKCSTKTVTQGYRPMKHELSSPDLPKRSGGGNGGGATTPSSCASVHVVDCINSWTNYVPYDDKLETSSQHFKVDFSKTIENGNYGMILAGKVRNDLTMEWTDVAVKSGKTERDDNFILEAILTELKILASLPKTHGNIVNLIGAYTKLLHKRQAYVFVDYCENGNLADFIDLNRPNFKDIFSGHPGKMEELCGGPVPINNNLSAAASLPSQPSSSANSSPVPAAASTVGPPKSAHVNTINIEEPKAIPFSLKELLAWSWHIADGLHFLHKNRILHGNLKTSNLYVTSNLLIKVGNIGYPPEESLECIDATTKKFLAVPNFSYQQFSKKSDVWNYGRVLWEIFSLRLQQCPDERTIRDFMRYEEVQKPQGVEVVEGIEMPDHANTEMFELLLLCWNENGTLCPEFDFFSKAFKHLYKEMFPSSKNASESATATTTV
ncbi:unnamed protein product [Orchesella dallaii]|uniref:Uncharacterized protein n=1 Tax=Orchesella dallaii TaxID=48710 RepID=A0ABP1RCB4_9HEXA